MAKKQEWFKIVHCGRGPVPADGPWKSREEAEGALDRFRSRHGWRAGTHLAASNATIVGPFPSRIAARKADISDYCKYLKRSR